MAMNMNGGRIKVDPPPGGKLVRDWLGLRVRTLVPLQNGRTALPVGFHADVDGIPAGTGLTLRTDACPHCGVQVFITRVHSSDVEVIPTTEAKE